MPIPETVRQAAIRLARACAVRTEDAPYHGYQPTPEQVATWEPHEWVITAIVAAATNMLEPLDVLLQKAQAVADAVPPVIAILQDYDESFPHASKEGDGEACDKLVETHRALVQAIAAAQPRGAGA